ncbi:hypothetical protein N7481_006219 [Penicillium waksmanii]|uniref:uncharacterized protein n=1 Tax=Penicillium waksmanii TaxID=69791 RepID=UPI00254734CF|nr:uncharacterized protein N7481_006219 [Penicillium waksmanii]KAJ5984120.1 hypothetical protein N7481_006219 [Penicillium waksmanii]
MSSSPVDLKICRSISTALARFFASLKLKRFVLLLSLIQFTIQRLGFFVEFPLQRFGFIVSPFDLLLQRFTFLLSLTKFDSELHITRHLLALGVGLAGFQSRQIGFELIHLFVLGGQLGLEFLYLFLHVRDHLFSRFDHDPGPHFEVLDGHLALQSLMVGMEGLMGGAELLVYTLQGFELGKNSIFAGNESLCFGFEFLHPFGGLLLQDASLLHCHNSLLKCRVPLRKQLRLADLRIPELGILIL